MPSSPAPSPPVSPASVAVVIPCYNAGPWIERTVRSALQQNLPGLAVIVVDDGSSDGSPDLVRDRFGEAVTVQTGPNRGANHARNRGLAWAEEIGATYILFLDADDYLEGDMLAGAVEIAGQKAAQMVLSNMHLEEADGTRTLRPRYEGRVTGRTFLHGWMHRDYVNPSAILWRTDFVRSLDGWDESLTRAQDLDITLRACLQDPVIWKCERGAAIHAQVNDGSISRQVSEAALDSRFRAVTGIYDRVKDDPAHAEILERFYYEYYHIARQAFKAGHIAFGRRVMRDLRGLGYRGHYGTIPHRLLCSVIGLERKTRLWGA